MLQKQIRLNNTLLVLLIIVSAISYTSIGYIIPRESFYQLCSAWCILFVSYYLMVRFWSENIYSLLIISIGFRAILLFAFPLLSDDIYRFLWDGHLTTNGINPYLYKPSELLELDVAINKSTYEQLNSPHYYSIYPPFLQYLFAISAFIGTTLFESMIALKSIVLLFEVGTIVILTRLLQLFQINLSKALLYALNPLVIVELSGNAHLEGIMIFFLLLSIYLLQQNKWKFSAIIYAFSIQTKLIPLMFLPFFIKRLSLKRASLYFLLILVVSVLLVVPFFNHQLLVNISKSINLYFQTFEFNASIYYLAREAGLYITRYNNIAIIGPGLSIITTLFIFIYAMRERIITIKQLPKTMFTVLFVYLLMSTTVHPWYLTTLVVLSPFVLTSTAIVWSFTAIISYHAYSQPDYTENMWVISLEYVIVFGYFFYEWRWGKTS